MGAGWAPFERKAATMVRIRRMEEGDAADMHRLHGAAVRQVCAKTVTPAVVEAWLYGRTPEGYLRAEPEGGEAFWVAVDRDGQTVGFGSWRADELIGLYVDPNFHGQGIGRALFAACEDDGRRTDMSSRGLSRPSTRRASTKRWAFATSRTAIVRSAVSAFRIWRWCGDRCRGETTRFRISTGRGRRRSCTLRAPHARVRLVDVDVRAVGLTGRRGQSSLRTGRLRSEHSYR